MVAVSMLMRCRPCSFRHKDVLVAGLLALTGAGLMSCASTQELYAEYDQQFCPVDGVGVVVPASTTVQKNGERVDCLLYTSPSPRDLSTSRMPSSA